MVLPPEGVTFYAIPREFGVPLSYRYAVVNDEVVLVDPVTREFEGSLLSWGEGA